MKRMLLTLLAAFALSAAPAYAAAGGGSAGFHGGGGGGGGGGKIFILLWLITHPIALGLVLIAGAALAPAPSVPTAPHKPRRHKRARRVALAAAEASEDDAAFDPALVRDQAIRLFKDIQSAWDARDRGKLADMVGPDLMVEWKCRLDDFDRKGWHNRVNVKLGPEI